MTQEQYLEQVRKLDKLMDEISKHQEAIDLLNRECREIVNYLDLNKPKE